MSSSDNLPDYGLEMESSDSEVTIEEPLHVEPLNEIPPGQFDDFGPQPFVEEGLSEDEVMQPIEPESESESDIEEEEPSPLANPPIIAVGATVYLKVEPLYSYEWKDETNHGIYFGPVRIVARPEFMRYRLGGLPGGFVRRYGDTFAYRRLVARRPDPRYTIDHTRVDFNFAEYYAERPRMVLNEFKFSLSFPRVRMVKVVWVCLGVSETCWTMYHSFRRDFPQMFVDPAAEDRGNQQDANQVDNPPVEPEANNEEPEDEPMYEADEEPEEDPDEEEEPEEEDPEEEPMEEEPNEEQEEDNDEDQD